MAPADLKYISWSHFLSIIKALPSSSAFKRLLREEQEKKSKRITFATQAEAVDYAKSGYGLG